MWSKPIVVLSDSRRSKSEVLVFVYDPYVMTPTSAPSHMAYNQIPICLFDADTIVLTHHGEIHYDAAVLDHKRCGEQGFGEDVTGWLTQLKGSVFTEAGIPTLKFFAASAEEATATRKAERSRRTVTLPARYQR